MILLGDWAPKNRAVAKINWSDLCVINCEGPILSNDLGQFSAATKAGPCLSHTSLPQLPHPGILVLANNHSMDFGEDGLRETRRVALENGWRVVGAGSTLSASQAPLIFDLDGVRSAIVARCEQQFGAAASSRGGVAVVEPGLARQVALLKAECDIVIVSIHQAAENIPWPSPSHQDAMRHLIESGADIVYGHHAHVPQGYERWENGIIFYSLGNFCVDPARWRFPNTLWSLAPKISVEAGQVAFEANTVEIVEKDGVIHIEAASPSSRSAHGSYLEIANGPLHDRGLLEALWQEASVRSFNDYYARWLRLAEDEPVSLGTIARRTKRDIRALAKKLLRGAAPTNGLMRPELLLPYHLFACETHRDAIATALGVLGGELPDLRTRQTAAMVDAIWLSR